MQRYRNFTASKLLHIEAFCDAALDNAPIYSDLEQASSWSYAGKVPRREVFITAKAFVTWTRPAGTVSKRTKKHI